MKPLATTSLFCTAVLAIAAVIAGAFHADAGLALFRASGVCFAVGLSARLVSGGGVHVV